MDGAQPILVLFTLVLEEVALLLPLASLVAALYVGLGNAYQGGENYHHSDTGPTHLVSATR